MSNEKKLIIYTDGSSRGNPGPGGYGAILMFGNQSKELSGGFRKTTNNRMELLAVIKALQALTKKNIAVTIYTDSRYVADAISKGWLQNWLATNFKGGKKNKDLWIQYQLISRQFSITIQWVKGHANNPFNNRCDLLATSAADGKNLLIDEGYESIEVGMI